MKPKDLAAALARKVAIQTDTGIMIMQDQKLRYITAEELRQEALTGEQDK